MGSAMPSCLEDMVSSGLHLSDFPAHDMSRDRVLLADCVKVGQRGPMHLDKDDFHAPTGMLMTEAVFFLQFRGMDGNRSSMVER